MRLSWSTSQSLPIALRPCLSRRMGRRADELKILIRIDRKGGENLVESKVVTLVS